MLIYEDDPHYPLNIVEHSNWEIFNSVLATILPQLIEFGPEPSNCYSGCLALANSGSLVPYVNLDWQDRT